VHSLADASQKSTWPVVSEFAPTVTLAVSVTAVPDATVVTGWPPEVIAMVVVVAGVWPQSFVVPETLSI